MKRAPQTDLPHPRLRVRDVAALAVFGLRTRSQRSALSALGIAIGVATLVAVLGISQSSSARLIDQLNRLGTNLLAATPTSLFGGQQPTLPAVSPAMVQRIGPVQAASAIGDPSTSIYRNSHIPAANTDALTVYAALPNLITTLQGQIAQGHFLNGITDRYPTVVLGATTARVLGIDRTDGQAQLWLAHRWFTVIGILAPIALAPDLDRAALIGFPATAAILHHPPPPAEIYIRAGPDQIDAVQSVLPATIDPAQPQDVAIARPSDALAARAAAKTTFQGLFLALGGLALAVGAIGIANVMVLGVLERRTEIGLRRALGATRRQVAGQFLAEATVISLLGGIAGIAAGSLATIIYADLRHWQIVIPPSAVVGGATVAIAVGAIAGLYPATRAARVDPTESLRAT